MLLNSNFLSLFESREIRLLGTECSLGRNFYYEQDLYKISILFPGLMSKRRVNLVQV